MYTNLRLGEEASESRILMPGDVHVVRAPLGQHQHSPHPSSHRCLVHAPKRLLLFPLNPRNPKKCQKLLRNVGGTQFVNGQF